MSHLLRIQQPCRVQLKRINTRTTFPDILSAAFVNACEVRTRDEKVQQIKVSHQNLKYRKLFLLLFSFGLNSKTLQSQLRHSYSGSLEVQTLDVTRSYRMTACSTFYFTTLNLREFQRHQRSPVFKTDTRHLASTSRNQGSRSFTSCFCFLAVCILRNLSWSRHKALHSLHKRLLHRGSDESQTFFFLRLLIIWEQK